jgi:hypothetical protein
VQRRKCVILELAKTVINICVEEIIFDQDIAVRKSGENTGSNL